MDIEWVRTLCLSYQGTSEDIKWGNDLCFLVAGKMFCVVSLDPPFKMAFKVPDELFEEISTTEGFIPAPYMARAKWVLAQEMSRLTKKEWAAYIRQSYELVKKKLSKKLLKELGLDN